MVKLLTYNLLILLIFSCTVSVTTSENKNEIIVLETINHFDSYEENEQLANDLVRYRYDFTFQDSFPDMDKHTADGMFYQYFVSDADKEISFRLELEEKCLKYKDRLVVYFKEKIDGQIKEQVEKKEFYKELVNFSEQNMIYLDEGKYDLFWDNTSNSFKEVVEKNALITVLEGRPSIAEIGGFRILYSKNFYEEISGIENSDIYIVTFRFENDQNKFEQFSIVSEDGMPKIIGYEY